jgi:hypothetical protein
MKIILLNGASSTGKDTAAKFLLETDEIDNPVVLDKMSAPIKSAFAAMMMVEIDEFYIVDGYEHDKDSPIPLLGNKSYRNWQQDFSEKFMKPLYGVPIFSKLFLLRLEQYIDMYPPSDYVEPVIVVSDCGFQIEMDTIAQEFPTEDVLLLRLHRPGFDFTGDTREFVEPRGLTRLVEIKNDGTIPAFESMVLLHTLDFLKGTD